MGKSAQAAATTKLSNHKVGRVPPNSFLAEFMQERNVKSNLEAAQILGIEETLFAALLYSPVQVVSHDVTARIAPHFGLSHEDWFFKWRLGFGEITYSEDGSQSGK